MISSCRITGSLTRTPFSVRLFTYGFVDAPVEVMTSGRGAPGRVIVTLSKNGLGVDEKVDECLSRVGHGDWRLRRLWLVYLHLVAFIA